MTPLDLGARLGVIGGAAIAAGFWTGSWVAGVTWFLSLWAIVVLGGDGKGGT